MKCLDDMVKVLVADEFPESKGVSSLASLINDASAETDVVGK